MRNKMVRFFTFMLIILALSLISCNKSIVVKEEGYDLSYIIRDPKSWVQGDLEKLESNIDNFFPDSQIEKKRYLVNEDSKDELCYWIISLSDSQKSIKIEDIFGNLRDAKSRNINKRNWTVIDIEVRNFDRYEQDPLDILPKAVYKTGISRTLITKTEKYVYMIMYELNDKSKIFVLEQFTNFIKIDV